jgi:hypothetical protein
MNIKKIKRVTKSSASDRMSGFMADHIQAGDFWNDESYEDDVVALAVLGYERAKRAVEENGYSMKRMFGQI